ncbi:di-trans,poly-cis-decaprenylcistransferase [Candidatus Woesebacteria bacterium RIFCSPHIGHO2_01_FULL_44_10]|uniref:Isoprenyl transferase n=1 Tax=Candidatus Woesebacteria bacterium RIFCSPLOWO2_01_FULL_44_14 TaxID=1802525 RepID=A0A1F8BZ07_9BACT|nr:MAG: di-trans,poly-cis-decaprenylcistransferase [Candidatus Woesebacteria bacterium RIFCSPHIGHO2_01_FULL_44_10]OGM54290.1 MAG: di-trans,poly-cis-decaprenylcistransferase [Candidatus Woesebacteria bacterium RIFCSPHIGHO2_12_FULL_44_11]OGM68595.1 MAG: di-trans,poly-cis-decaprenylcistransferase [Candidatus Woesebacteria bacterium RIFCSPLOWO2_01_FULL_44_14]
MTEKLLALPKGTVVPDHLAIIPDGNRRWARARGLDPIEGHRAGAKRAMELIRAARNLGVHTTTFWGLSTENWRERNEKEVKWIMKIIGKIIDDNVDEANKDGARIVHLGRKERLPKTLIDKVNEAEDKTKNNTKFIFNIALDYGGQDEIVRAIQKMIKAKVRAGDVDIKLVDKYMDTADQPYPYPDLFIRTSGEQRTSGLLLWQSHYVETYWEDDHFPDFSPEKMREAILDYSRRRRRFGGNDAVEHLKFKPELTAKLELDWWRLSKVPEGTRFRDFVIAYLAEQYGISKKHAGAAAKYLIWALANGNKKDWKAATRHLKSFYKLIRDHIKLAFEPEIVASLKVKFWQNPEDEAARALYAEEYRISDFQAAKAAHLRVLAQKERTLALESGNETHWKRAQDYLQKHYKALKDRVA